MQVVLFDLENRVALEQISQKLRSMELEVHDVSADVCDLPNGAYGSIDQIWYIGQVLSKIADMFSANLFPDGTEFIFDTELTILNNAITILAQNTQLDCKFNNFRDLL